jgi:hypothetical protein
MTTIVEATSFSSVQKLAADPPVDPRGDITRPLDPLVLYIARVPGSRDVFLTPIKPRNKTVGAEDVGSSLYYLHAHSLEDGKLASTGLEHSHGMQHQRHPETLVPRTGARPLAVETRWNGAERSMMSSERRYSTPASAAQQQLGFRSLDESLRPPPPPKDRRLSSPVLATQPRPFLTHQNHSENVMHPPSRPAPGPPLPTYAQSQLALAFSDPFRPPDRPFNRYAPEARARSSSPGHRNGYQNGINGASPVKAIRRKPVGQPAPLTIQPSHSSIFNSQAGDFPRFSPTKPTVPDSPPYPVDEVFPNVDNWRPKKPMQMPYESDLLYSLATAQSIPNGAGQPLTTNVVANNTPPMSPTSPMSPTFPTGSFTLIRRDPATGQQWNVAQLNNCVHKKYPYDQAKAVPSLEITIENPGYAKFVKPRRNSNLGGSTSTLNVNDATDSNGMPTFRREIFVEGLPDVNKSPTHGRSMSDDSTFHPQDSAVQPLDAPRFSVPTASTSTTNLLSTRYNRSSVTPGGNKRRTGLKFHSPWDGVCEFSTTISNSLKVSSVLPKKNHWLMFQVQTLSWANTAIF